MSHLQLSIQDVIVHGKAARKDVANVEALRKLARPAALSAASFLVGKTLFVWAPGDLTADDGISSIRPEGVPASGAGRYRTVALTAFGHAKK